MENPSTLHSPQIFVGYCELEEWADAIDPMRPVLALPIDEPGPSVNGIQVDHLVVICQQITTESMVLYCRLRAATLTRYCGAPLENDWQERQNTLHSLWSEVRFYLEERGLSIERAIVAAPQGCAFLEGRSRSIRFDPIIRRFVKAGPDDLSKAEALSCGSEAGSRHE